MTPEERWITTTEIARIRRCSRRAAGRYVERQQKFWGPALVRQENGPGSTILVDRVLLAVRDPRFDPKGPAGHSTSGGGDRLVLAAIQGLGARFEGHLVRLSEKIDTEAELNAAHRETTADIAAALAS